MVSHLLSQTTADSRNMLRKLPSPPIFSQNFQPWTEQQQQQQQGHPYRPTSKEIIFITNFPISQRKFFVGISSKMSSFPNTVAEGRRSGKAPEKSTFSQTCSLLSQFLKEKRASADSTFRIGGKMEPIGITFFSKKKLFIYIISPYGILLLLPLFTKFLLCDVFTIQFLLWVGFVSQLMVWCGKLFFVCCLAELHRNIYFFFLWNCLWWEFADGGVVCLDLKIPASTKGLLGSLQNSDGALKLSASAMEFLPQLVEEAEPRDRGHHIFLTYLFLFCLVCY